MRSIALGFLVLGCLFGSVQAQDYPVKPLKVIVPFAPGSAADYSTRFHAEKLSQAIGQAVVVENRPGANSVIGFMAVKDAPADGYTLLAASNSPMTVNPWTVKNLPYDAAKDFKPVSGLFRGQAAFVVPGSSKLRTLQELIAAGKAGELNVGTYAAGYTLFAHQFAAEAGIRIAIIPYKGLGQVLTDVAGGRLDLAIVDSGGTLPFVRDGRARALAVSGEARNSELPGVPTVRESGYPNYSAYTWLAFYVRADVPDAYVNKLAAAMQKVLETKEAKEFVLKHGGEQMPLAPEGMAKFHLAEYERMERVARAAGIKPE